MEGLKIKLKFIVKTQIVLYQTFPAPGEKIAGMSNIINKIKNKVYNMVNHSNLGTFKIRKIN